jgi:acetyl-CoA synthetase
MPRAPRRVVITADGGYRKGRVSPLKPAVDQALGDRGAGVQETVEHVLVVRRTGNEVSWDDDRDIWWHDAVPAASADHEARPFPAENPLLMSAVHQKTSDSGWMSCTTLFVNAAWVR